MGVDLGSAYGKIEIDASGVKAGVADAQQGLRGLVEAAAKVGAAMVAAGAAMTGLAGVGVKASMSLQSAFAGVAKTTDGLTTATGQLTQAGAEMKDAFVDMGSEIPTTIEELMKIGELGGQLGIAQSALTEFSESIAALGVSTNLTTEEGAVALARMANIFAVSAESMGDNTERLGSTLVALGNNFATTERDIVSFGERIAGAGQIAGLTQAEVLGIGAALSSVGVEAEAGGTAVQKVLLSMNQAVVEAGSTLEIFAQTAGMTADEFARLWDEDAARAFQLFVEGLAAAGDDAITILSDLELEDQRLIRAFLSLSNAGDLLGRSLDAANAAWDDNTALTNEAVQRYATLESQMATTKNDITAMAASFGDSLSPAVGGALDTVQRVAQALRDLPGPVQATVAQMTALGGATLTLGGGAMVLISKLTGPDGLLTAFRTLAAGLGTTALGILGPVGIIAALTALALYLKNVEDAHRDEATNILLAADTYPQYITHLQDAGLAAYDLSEALYAMVKAQDAANQAEFAAGLLDARKELANLAWDLDTATLQIRTLNEAGEQVLTPLNDMQLAVLTDAESVEQLGRELGKAGGELQTWVDTVVAAAEAENNARVSAQEYADFEHERQQVLMASIALAQEYVPTLEEEKEALRGDAEAAEAAAEATAALAEATGLTVDEMAALAEKTGLTVDEIRTLSESMDAEGILAYAQALGQARETLSGFFGALAGGVQDLAGIEQQMADATAEYKAALAKLPKAAADERAALKAEYDAQLADLQAALNEKKVAIALTIAETSGMLQQWAQETLGPDMAAAFDTAAEVLAGLESGLLPLDQGLADMLDGVIAKLDEIKGQTADIAADNADAVQELGSGEWVTEMESTLAGLEEDLKGTLDLSEVMDVKGIQDAVSEIQGEIEKVSEAAPEKTVMDPLFEAVQKTADYLAEAPLSKPMADEAAAFKTAMGDIVSLIGAIPNIHTTQLRETGGDAVIEKAAEIEEALEDIPTQIDIQVNAHYNPDPALEWTNSVALEYALYDLQSAVDEMDPLELNFDAKGAAGFTDMMNSLIALMDLLRALRRYGAGGLQLSGLEADLVALQDVLQRTRWMTAHTDVNFELLFQFIESFNGLLAAMDTLTEYQNVGEAQFAALLADLDALVRTIAAVANLPFAPGTVPALERVGLVAGALGQALSTLQRLMEYQAVPVEAMTAFAADMVRIVAMLEEVSGLVSGEMVDSAVNLAIGLGLVGVEIGNAAGGLTQLADYQGSVADKMGPLVDDLLAAVAELAAAADLVTDEALGKAKDFAEGAASIATDIGRAADDLTKLAEYSGTSTEAMTLVAQDLLAAAQAVADVAAGLDAETLAEAESIAESMSGIARALGGAVDALTDIADYAGVADLRDKAMLLGADLGRAVEAILAGMMAAAGLDQETLDAAAEWARSAGTIIGVIGTAVTAMEALRDYGGLAVEALDQLEADLPLVVSAMLRIAAQYENEGVAAAAEFSESVGTIARAVGQAVGGLAEVAQFGGVPGEQMALFEQDVTALLLSLANVNASLAGTDAASLEALGAAMEALGRGVLEMMDAMWNISAYQGGIGAGLDALLADLYLLIEAFQELQGVIPQELIPHSPPPLAAGLRDVAAAMREVQAASMATLYPAAMGPNPPGMAGADQRQFNSYFDVPAMDAESTAEYVLTKQRNEVRYGIG